MKMKEFGPRKWAHVPGAPFGSATALCNIFTAQTNINTVRLIHVRMPRNKGAGSLTVICRTIPMIISDHSITDHETFCNHSG